jgi:Domain of unknown function (DUF4062)
MDKRYQVFVSSTFIDLQEERKEIMQALLELDCMPAGMELFPAANDDQWTLIKKVINDCDYYIVIIAGRYGSIGPDGKSYTQMEYEYALERGKPIIAFLHKSPETLPAKVSEGTPEGRERLDKFRKMAQQKMCKYWQTPIDLGSVVSRSLVQLIKSNPAVGWVKADLVPSEGASKEILRLKSNLEELEKELSFLRNNAPAGSIGLSQGSESFKIRYSFHASWREPSYSSQDCTSQFSASWNDIFNEVAPLLIDEASIAQIRNSINSFIIRLEIDLLKKDADLKEARLSNFAIEEADLQTIKVQLRALGLITKSSKPRSVKNPDEYWTLTPYGDSLMVKLRAIKSEEDIDNNRST